MSVKYLGITIDEKLTREYHMNETKFSDLPLTSVGTVH